MYLYPPESTNQTTVSRNADSKTYTNKTYHYSVSYPGYLGLTDTPYTAVFQEKQSQFARADFPAMYISSIPAGFTDNKKIYNFMPLDVIEKLFSASINEGVQIAPGEDAKYWTYTKLATLQVSGESGIIIQNNNVEHSEGDVNRMILVRKNGVTYIIGSYYKTQQELDDFYHFLSSFHFTD